MSATVKSYRDSTAYRINPMATPGRGDDPYEEFRSMERSRAVGYYLHIQHGRGPVMLWNGRTFSNDSPAHIFRSEAAAVHKGTRLLSQYQKLHKYRMWVGPRPFSEEHMRVNPGRRRHSAKWDRCVRKVKAKGTAVDPYAVCTAALKKRRKRRTFTAAELRRIGRRSKRGTLGAAVGRDAGLRRNPSTRDKLDAAAKKLEDFTGHEATHVVRAPARSDEKTGYVIGELDLIGYRAKRDGKIERYGHKFRTRSRPLLAVTTDGKQLHIVGGRYELTDAGIEDR